MLKKLTSFIVLIVMILTMASTGIVCLAESSALVKADLIFNGGMEWMNTSYQFWSGTHTPETRVFHSGNKSWRINVDANRAMYTQYGTGVVPGQTYTFTYWIYTEESLEQTFELNNYLYPAGAGVKIEIYAKQYDATGDLVSEKTIVTDGAEVYNPTGDELGTWVQRTVTVNVPENGYTKNGYTYYPTGDFYIQIRPQGTGSVCYDDISFSGPVSAETAESINNKRASYQEGYDLAMSFFNAQADYTEYSELADGAVNFVKNPGFETADAYYNDRDEEFYYTTTDGKKSYQSGAANWSRSDYGRMFDSSSYEIVSRTSVENRTKDGGYSMRVTVPEGYSASGYAPMFMQPLSPSDENGGFVAGADYILSCWVKTKDVSYGSGVFYKVQANYDGGYYTLGNRSVAVYDAADEWTEVKYVFTMPENITSVYIYIRLLGTGTFYCDDVVFGRSSNKNPLDFSTKHTFYYTEDGVVDATARIKTNLFEIEDGSTVTFRIEDENGNIAGDPKTLAAAETVSVTFPVSTLTELKKKYILNVEYKNPDGDIISSGTKRIYRYNRPTAINENGNYVDENTGEEIYPLFMYGQKFTTNEDLAAGGFTVVRPDFNLASDDSIQASLDDIHANGMKALIALYGNVAGHPKQIERTREVVTKFKDHPATAAWMLMDEPSLQVQTGSVLTYDEMLYYLEEGYKAVREIDDVHPVYNIETTGAIYDSIERTSQMCDIFAIDPYPSSTYSSISGYLANSTQRAINAVSDERPVWVLGLAAEWSGDYASPTVNSAMLRFQIYDALWAGAKGAGHYLGPSAAESKAAGGEHKVTETVNGPIYNETFKQASETGEIKELFEHFSLGRHKVFAEGAGNGYQWRAWCKDNGDMFLAVRSKLSDSGTVLAEATATFDLVSSDGQTSIDGFNATLVNGISEQTVTSSTSEFKCTITAGEVSLYKIKKGYTLSNLTASSADTSVTVKYDVANNFTDGGTVIYAFYDAQGRLLEMKKGDATEAAELEKPQSTITKKLTFEKEINFKSMKVFIWDSVIGMIPLSNMIEFIK